MADVRAILPEEHKLLISIAAQLLNGPEVTIGDQRILVTRVGRGRLRSAKFFLNGRAMVAIEQNSAKPSRWGQLAKNGHQVVQFQDLATKKYLAVVVDGKMFEYGRK